MCFVSSEDLNARCVTHLSLVLPVVPSLQTQIQALFKGFGVAFLLVLLTRINKCEASNDRFNNTMINASAFATNFI